MKKLYEKPEADKISFNYRDQVVAASAGDVSGGGSGMDNFIKNVSGIGFPVCGDNGFVDYLLEIFSNNC